MFSETAVRVHTKPSRTIFRPLPFILLLFMLKFLSQIIIISCNSWDQLNVLYFAVRHQGILATCILNLDNLTVAYLLQ
jgi:hypothetical protein